MWFSLVKLHSGAVPSCHVPQDMLHVKSAQCVARDLHIIIIIIIVVIIITYPRAESDVQHLRFAMQNDWINAVDYVDL